MQIQIDHQCPQCGAPAVLEETDRLYACEFCRVKSYLLAGDVFRYLLPDHAPENQDLTYVPYWRFKGMVFFCGDGDISHRFVDVSQCAVPENAFPYSIGFRSQVLRLRFVTSESGGRFLTPRIGRREAMQHFAAGFAANQKPPIHVQEHIGESLSLIYAPTYQRLQIYDAVLNRPLSADTPPEAFLDRLEGTGPPSRFQFIAAICPSCGWDLEGRRDSLLLLCRNCDRAWQAGHQDLVETRIASLATRDTNAIYLPFWRIQAQVDGVDLNSMADMVRLANLPRVVQAPWETRPFYFWSLAFKVRPRTLLQLARKLTLAQPEVEAVETLPKAELYPVTLPLNEAAESLTLVLAAFMKPPRRLYPLLPSLRITPRKYLLAYIPFTEGPHEYHQEALKLHVNKNQLRLAGNL